MRYDYQTILIAARHSQYFFFSSPCLPATNHQHQDDPRLLPLFISLQD
uniref:Uncharacterized protein n=1 Tax=Arundo donax TaxID=35708 RepID=A0A0A9SGU7_ARUDO